ILVGVSYFVSQVTPRFFNQDNCAIFSYLQPYLCWPKRTLTCILRKLYVFRRCLGELVGGWGQLVGFVRREHTRVLLAFSAAIALAFFAAIFYLRQPEISGSPQIYFYLEVGGTLLSFCYAANALVRFRGTHDRTALILAFGFVLSGIIETVGYFGLDNLL